MPTLNRSHKPTVTVGVPTYEGSQSLVVALQSVYTQTAIRHIKEVIVVVDGKTLDASILEQIQHPLLKVLQKKTRKGQSARLNDLFESATSDLLVLTNDDTVLDPHAVERLAAVFQSTRADMLSGYVVPFKGHSYLESALLVGYELNHRIIAALKKDSYLSCNGRLLALSHALYSTLRIPEKLWNNDAFMYFFTKAHGFAYTHVLDAKVQFTSPQNMGEHLKQSQKFQHSLRENQTQFSLDLSAEYRVPKSALLIAAIQTFLQKPIDAVGYLGLLVYSRLSPAPSQQHTHGFWETDRSTKHIAAGKNA